MIKYVVETDNQRIEFSSLEDAQLYIDNNQLNVNIQQIEEEDNRAVTVPSFITPRQFRIAWIMSGRSLSDIDNLIDSLPEPNKTIAKITYEYSIEFQRNNPILNSMASSIGLTQEQLDEFFIFASTL